MLLLVSLVIAVALPLSGQTPTGVSGRWIGDDTRMHPGGDAVASAIGAERLPRVPRQPRSRELLIEEQTDAVQLEKPGATRLSLPLSGVAVTTTDAAGHAISARARREGAELVVLREQTLRLPGGTEVAIEIEERHQLQPDGTLRVDTTTTSGSLVETQRTIYRRVVQ